MGVVGNTVIAHSTAMKMVSKTINTVDFFLPMLIKASCVFRIFLRKQYLYYYTLFLIRSSTNIDEYIRNFYHFIEKNSLSVAVSRKRRAFAFYFASNFFSAKICIAHSIRFFIMPQVTS